jgi:hypothetical protein
VRIGEWIERYGRAWEDADAEAAAELFTEDATYQSSPFREPHRGREGIRQYWRRATASQSNVAIEFGQPVLQDRKAVVEWWARMDDDGEPLTLPGALILTFDDDGLCSALREYYNLEPGARIPPPAGWGT